MRGFLEVLAEGLRECGAEDRGVRYLAGVSGGADSVGLLWGLGQLGYERVVVCYFDHGLRPGDAAVEAGLVRDLAARCGYDFEEGCGDAAGHARREGMSVEAGARDLRLNFFEVCAERHGCWKIFLGHHADDQIETILLNIFRGSGLAGLCGMRMVARVGRLELLRPMLRIRREVVRNFVGERGLRFAEDPTNRETVYLRNRVRHRVIPILREVFGEVGMEALLRMAGILRVEEDFLASMAPSLPFEFGVEQLEGLPLALRGRSVLRWLRAGGVPEAGYSEVAAVLSLCDVEGGPAKVNLPGGFHARRRGRRIFLDGGGGRGI